MCGFKNQSVQEDFDLFPSIMSRYEDVFDQPFDIKLLLMCIPSNIGKEKISSAYLFFSMNHVNLFILSFGMLVQEVQNAIKDLNGRNKWSSFSIHRFNMVYTSFSIH